MAGSAPAGNPLMDKMGETMGKMTSGPMGDMLNKGLNWARENKDSVGGGLEALREGLSAIRTGVHDNIDKATKQAEEKKKWADKKEERALAAAKRKEEKLARKQAKEEAFKTRKRTRTAPEPPPQSTASVLETANKKGKNTKKPKKTKMNGKTATKKTKQGTQDAGEADSTNGERQKSQSTHMDGIRSKSIVYLEGVQ